MPCSSIRPRLPEQVVDDVVSSAFMSAGQRCSALRLLFLQEEIADTVLEMLVGRHGRTRHRRSGRSSRPMWVRSSRRGRGRRAEPACRAHAPTKPASSRRARLDEAHVHGSFVAPHLIELKSAAQLTREEFGPILHVVRYRSGDINKFSHPSARATIGLTLGVQTRLGVLLAAGIRETRRSAIPT